MYEKSRVADKNVGASMDKVNNAISSMDPNEKESILSAQSAHVYE
jgi:hypothetical protein